MPELLIFKDAINGHMELNLSVNVNGKIQIEIGVPEENSFMIFDLKEEDKDKIKKFFEKL